jgi:hypothetical protein
MKRIFVAKAETKPLEQISHLVWSVSRLPPLGNDYCFLLIVFADPQGSFLILSPPFPNKMAIFSAGQ